MRYLNLYNNKSKDIFSLYSIIYLNFLRFIIRFVTLQSDKIIV